MICKITGNETKFLFTAKLLSKYDVKFFRCQQTGFIQAEEPYWLEEAYSSAITKLDVGLVMRNENLVKVAVPLLQRYFKHEGIFLDYAGGYGLFTRMMRDRGFNFYHTDPYCQNLFAEYQDLKESPTQTGFDMVTAFEVLEHMQAPLPEIEKVLALGKNLFFTTELVPPDVTKDWWYFSFETGQHISFYTEDALRFIAKRFRKHYYTDGRWLHLFTGEPLMENPFEVLNRKVREKFFIRKMRKYLRQYDQRQNPSSEKTSLIGFDTEEAKRRIGR